MRNNPRILEEATLSQSWRHQISVRGPNFAVDGAAALRAGRTERSLTPQNSVRLLDAF